MSQKPRRRTEDELQQLMFQRVLRHLTHIQSDVPFPLIFLQRVLDADLMVEDPPDVTELSDTPPPGTQRVIAILVTPPAPIALDMGEIFDIVGTDPERAVITVSKIQRVALQEALRELRRTNAWIPEHTLEESEIIFTSELSQLANDPKETLAPDHLALLAAHGLAWLAHALMQEDAGGAYSAVQLSAALWKLVVREVLAPAELIASLPQVLAHAERYGGAWNNDPMPHILLASLGATLAEAEESGIQIWIDRTFALGERLAEPLTADTRQDVLRHLQQARRRAGR
jgi:hypothetical protein